MNIKYLAIYPGTRRKPFIWIQCELKIKSLKIKSLKNKTKKK